MCPHEEKVTAWLLGDLPPGEAQAMTRHLEACAECRAVRDDCAGVLAPLQSALAKDRWPGCADEGSNCLLKGFCGIPQKGVEGRKR